MLFKKAFREWRKKKDPGKFKCEGTTEYTTYNMTLVKNMDLVFSNTQTVNFQVFKLVLEKAEEPEIKLPTSVGS